MATLVEKIKEKIRREIEPEELILIDNSHLHVKHKFFDINKSHIKIIIKSKKLKGMDKISAHKKIFSLLETEVKTKIHALEIEIK